MPAEEGEATVRTPTLSITAIATIMVNRERSFYEQAQSIIIDICQWSDVTRYFKF
jgi:hypothetical protein